MNYCRKYKEYCDNANMFGGCDGLTIACTKSASWDNTHPSNETGNLTTAPKRDDGIYMQLFIVKDGTRYDMKVVDLKDVSTILVNSLMDGINKLYT